MKILKNSMFTFILGAIIFSTITALAISGINANQVTYTDKNNTDTTVNLALDKLYNNLDSRIIMNTFGTPLYSTSAGDAINVRTTTLSLNEGKYIVIASKGLGWLLDTTSLPTYSSSDTNLGSGWENLKCTNSNCNISFLGKYWNRVLPSAKFGNYYTQYTSTIYVYYVDVLKNGDTLSTYLTNSVSTIMPSHVTLMAIPINEN